MAILYMFPRFPICFLMFHLLLPRFLWVFPMFPPVSYFRSYEFELWEVNLISPNLVNVVDLKKITYSRLFTAQWTHLCRVTIDLTSKVH